VQAGEIVTLIGANGAGKSTTLRAISGLVKPRSGEILLRGHAHPTAAPPTKWPRSASGNPPKGRRIFPKLTVEENLDIGAYLEKNPAVIAQRKAYVYDLFPRLGERCRQDGGTLSGGEQQMLAIGRALMQDPALLLLDEPTLGLAPVLVEALFETLEKLHAAGKTMLLVEQNAWHALHLAQRAYVLQTGAIIKQAPPATWRTTRISSAPTWAAIEACDAGTGLVHVPHLSFGAVAHLVEHHVRNVGVEGSSPFRSTILRSAGLRPLSYGWRGHPAERRMPCVAKAKPHAKQGHIHVSRLFTNNRGRGSRSGTEYFDT
jgi:branched-chain amino acid transport system ATP-binding protein